VRFQQQAGHAHDTVHRRADSWLIVARKVLRALLADSASMARALQPGECADQ